MCSCHIILLPFYDKGYWFKPGIVKTLLDGMSCIIDSVKGGCFACLYYSIYKIYSINKELIRYNTINPNLPKPKNNIKTAVIVLAVINCCVSYIEIRLWRT